LVYKNKEKEKDYRLKEFSLKEKTVVVTGGNGLIGKEVCDACAGAGASLAILDIASAETLHSLSQSLSEKHSVDSSAFHVDISMEKSVHQVIDAVIEKFEKIDVLINLAAIDAKFDQAIDQVPKTSFEHFPLDIWKKSIDVNITGTFIMTQKVVREMLKRKEGNIINVASTYSLVAPNQNLYRFDDQDQQVFKPVDYVVSKSSIPNFSRYLATFYGNKGIRSNTIVPHGIYNHHPSDFLKNFKKYSPLGRMCKIEEIRGPFVFLASDASSYMTGSTIVVDGGWTAW